MGVCIPFKISLFINWLGGGDGTIVAIEGAWNIQQQPKEASHENENSRSNGGGSDCMCVGG